MYYLIYIPLYLISLLPFPVLYFFADGIYAILYYVFGYRKKVVMTNLLIAFPGKSENERTRIAKDFYHNFVDTFIETIKMLSMPEKSFAKRFSLNLDGMEKAYECGKPIHIVSMHNFNWEYANWGLSRGLKYPLVVIYMPVGNKAFNKLVYDLRSRFGSKLIPAVNFRRNYIKYANTKHVLANVGDQSPGNPATAYWTNFFGRPTAFVTGPEKGARSMDAAIVFAHFYPTDKRGYYHLDTEFLTDTPRTMANGDITRLYIKFLERSIQKKPANYLWSHRRWKHEYKESYGPLL
ncbi:MAG: lipid A biosynthesis acyltransferase [Chitinophagaceae bacterium]|nr:lipid A biosynthesis acyltransferase [Chitinophagaceae bacterium]